MATDRLILPEATAGQSNKIVTINDAFADLDKLIGDTLVYSLTAGGSLTLSEDDSKYGVYVLTGTLPSNTTLNFNTAVQHPILIIRDGSNATFTLTLQKTSGGTTSDWESTLIQQGDVLLVFMAGTTGHDIGMVPMGTGNVLYTGGKIAAVLGASEVVFRQVATHRAKIRANAVGSQAVLAVAATAQTDMIFKKNGTDVGTIRFAAAGTVATFVGNFTAAIDIAVGDILTCEGPAGADATAAGFAFSIKGHRR